MDVSFLAKDPGPVTRTACLNDGNDCCYKEFTIEVKYCYNAVDSGFFVYKFSDVDICPAGFCISEEELCAEGQIWDNSGECISKGGLHLHFSAWPRGEGLNILDFIEKSF